MRKLSVILLLAGGAVFQTSCMTSNLLARAEGRPLPGDPPNAQFVPQPGYYALVPLAFPLDVISFPIQFAVQQPN
jgi:hypothetical protein